MGSYMRTEIKYGSDVGRLAESYPEAAGDVHLHSIGRNSEIIKDVGTAADMDGKHSIAWDYGHPRHRARPHGDGEPGGHQPLPPLLGISLSLMCPWSTTGS